MYAVSSAFSAALLKSHKVVFKAEVLVNGAVVTTLTSQLTGGHVTVDGTAQVSRSGVVTFADRTGALVPLLTTDSLQPYGNELRIWRGIQFSDGTTEYVPLITGTIWDSEVDDTESGLLITCEIYDRARLVSANAWDDVYTIAAGTNYATAIQTLIQSRLPSQISGGGTWTATAEVTPLLILGDQSKNDPFANALDMAAAIGMYLNFSPLGVPQLLPVPDPLTTIPSVTIAERSNLLTIKRRLTAEATYNGVIAVGENSGAAAPYRATAWDTSLSSPTYYLGKFGKRPTYYSSPLINSAAAATAAANAQLLLNLGGTEVVSFGTIVNPALAPFDVALLTRVRAGITGIRYVLESFTVPLDVTTALEATCRVRRTA